MSRPTSRERPAPPERPLPVPLLDDPPAPGLDLAPFRGGPIPVPEPDSAPLEQGGFVLQGYAISSGDDGEMIIEGARGRRLKGVPDKLRRDEDFRALMRGLRDDRARGRRARRALEERMISGAPFSALEISWLVEDDAFAPLLRGLLVAPASGGAAGGAGLLVAWDRERGLGLVPLDYDARWVGWLDLEIVHPLKVPAAADPRGAPGLGALPAWQDLLVDLGLKQPLAQVFREVRTLPPAQRDLVESPLLSARETRAAWAIERALTEEGWVPRRGVARRRLSVRDGGAMFAVEAWFDHGESYLPDDPTTTGAFGFTRPGGRERLRLGAVPAVLLSETIRSLEIALARAGAARDDVGGGEGEGDSGG